MSAQRAVVFGLVALLAACGEESVPPGPASIPPCEAGRANGWDVRLGLLAGRAPPKTLRVLSVAHRLSLASVESPKAYRDHFGKILIQAAPCLSKEYENLVVFPEYTGLPLAFLGARGKGAREQKTLQGALMWMAGRYLAAMTHYATRFPSTAKLQGRLVLLSLTDPIWRVFLDTFSALAKEHQVYLMSCTVAAEVDRVAAVGQAADTFVDPTVTDRAYYYEAASPEVYNACFLFSPAGKLVHQTRKVNLVATEKTDLQLTPGALSQLSVYRVPGTNVDLCAGISLDAFLESYVSTLDKKGCDLFLQPDANPRSWASEVGSAKTWQPAEWLDSTMGVLASKGYLHASGKKEPTSHSNILI